MLLQSDGTTHTSTTASALSDADRYFTVPEAHFGSFFTVQPDDDPCYVDHYEVTNATVNTLDMTMTGSRGSNATDGTHALRLDRTVKTPVTQKMSLQASTRGLKNVTLPIEF